MRIQKHQVLPLILMFSILGISAGDASSPQTPEEHVSTPLYGSVSLPCRFPFIQSVEGLMAIWKKENNGSKQILYRILAGKENLEEQDPRYQGRVELSTKLPQGDLSLTLKNITCEDEGTYICRAVNKNNSGEKKVTLSIDGLDEDVPTVTVVTIDGKRRMKCTGSGVYCNPWVKWNTTRGEDLSIYGKLNITDQSNGRMLVESVLEHEVDTDIQVLCHIVEGKLRKSAGLMIIDQKIMEEWEMKLFHIFVPITSIFSIIVPIIIIIIAVYKRKVIFEMLKCTMKKTDKAAMRDISRDLTDSPLETAL